MEVLGTDRVAPSGEGASQVLAEVFQFFDPDAEPDEPVIDAAGRADVGRDAGVRHRRRMADQRLDAAQALGQAEQPGSASEMRVAASVAAFQADADHAAEVAHLLRGDGVAGMVGRPG